MPKPPAADRTIGLFFTPAPPDVEKLLAAGDRPKAGPSTNVVFEALDRVASAAAGYRTAAIAGIVKVRTRAERDYDRAASKLDGALAELARLTGKTSWPKPTAPKAPETVIPQPGDLVTFEVESARIVGFVEAIDWDSSERPDDVIALCTGVEVAPAKEFARAVRRRMATSVRWRVRLADLVPLTDAREG